MSFFKSQKLLGLLRAGAGLAALGVLFFFSKIDLKALTILTNVPAATACIILVFVCVPIAALRWAILLRILGFDIAFKKLYHVTSITNFLNAFFIGPLGSDVTRAIYIWRIVGHSSASVASSIVVDRLLGLFSAFLIALLYVIFNWSWMKDIPALFTLALSVVLGFSGMIAVAGALLIAPALMLRLGNMLSRWPRITSLVKWAHRTVQSMIRNPMSLLAALALALLSQAVTVVAVLVVGVALGADTLRPADYMLAVPVTLVANTLPITPNGLGIGEAAFDQICRWLVTSSQHVPYSNIFFAFRLLGLVASLSGLISLLLYRNSPGSEPGEPATLKTTEG
jgi:glycosyltransferase 2 family protein